MKSTSIKVGGSYWTRPHRRGTDLQRVRVLDRAERAGWWLVRLTAPNGAYVSDTFERHSSAFVEPV